MTCKYIETLLSFVLPCYCFVDWESTQHRTTQTVRHAGLRFLPTAHFGGSNTLHNKRVMSRIGNVILKGSKKTLKLEPWNMREWTVFLVKLPSCFCKQVGHKIFKRPQMTSKLTTKFKTDLLTYMGVLGFVVYLIWRLRYGKNHMWSAGWIFVHLDLNFRGVFGLTSGHKWPNFRAK